MKKARQKHSIQVALRKSGLSRFEGYDALVLIKSMPNGDDALRLLRAGRVDFEGAFRIARLDPATAALNKAFWAAPIMAMGRAAIGAGMRAFGSAASSASASGVMNAGRSALSGLGRRAASSFSGISNRASSALSGLKSRVSGFGNQMSNSFGNTRLGGSTFGRGLRFGAGLATKGIKFGWKYSTPIGLGAAGISGLNAGVNLANERAREKRQQNYGVGTNRAYRQRNTNV